MKLRKHGTWKKDFSMNGRLGIDPEDDVSMEMVSFNVYGLERGYKYRVRGLFGAYALDSSLQEVWQAWTEDVLLLTNIKKSYKRL